MGNKILKIALPLIILGVIVFVINKTQKSIDGIAPTEVDPFSFGTYINDLVQTDLKDKPYAQAKDEYRRIYDIIKTEEQLVAMDSSGIQQPLLPDTTAQGCYRRIFEGYWPSYESLADGVFKSDWSSKTDQLSIIKMEAEDLQQRNGSIIRNDSLTRYLSYIGDYNAAISFVSKVSCSSKSQYDQLVTKKEVYKKKYPLSNNSSLVAQLNGVPGKAKSRWENSIKTSVKEACYKYNLNDFLSAKNGCENKISEYNNCFPNDKLSASETTTRLRNRWYELLGDAVNDACRIDNLSAFSNVYTDLRNKIDAYGSDPSDLKGRLSRKYNELRGY
jgi:hypothetical protein